MGRKELKKKPRRPSSPPKRNGNKRETISKITFHRSRTRYAVFVLTNIQSSREKKRTNQYIFTFFSLIFQFFSLSFLFSHFLSKQYFYEPVESTWQRGANYYTRLKTIHFVCIRKVGFAPFASLVYNNFPESFSYTRLCQ